MVSAEFAAAVPAVVLVLVAALTAVQWGVGVVRAQDTARLVARAAARGDPPSALADLVARNAPPGTTWRVAPQGDRVRVRVEVPLRGAGGWVLGGRTAVADATGLREDSSGVPP
ncbi:hypothetical protein G9U51_06320 [Calidifontibacter sp. DB0510]|uniref:Pilus assembly protein TadE n=1 Tax=Metallococcus carri TaxID=1656884 RepID=A0A967EGQ7_9MICO|nr:TadE family type IV pilus minor pilin [Metallococcus carri]NHN55398.1 hypothetical protein [Metallococcus carri]NOP36475.1 hypothetical protein [Calidifontibacter sp. DB2511S]